MVKIFNKIISKNYWISTIIIVLGIMILKSTVSNFILKYITLPTIVLDLISILVIVLIIRLLSEEVLEI